MQQVVRLMQVRFSFSVFDRVLINSSSQSPNKVNGQEGQTLVLTPEQAMELGILPQSNGQTAQVVQQQAPPPQQQQVSLYLILVN